MISLQSLYIDYIGLAVLQLLFHDPKPFSSGGQCVIDEVLFSRVDLSTDLWIKTACGGLSFCLEQAFIK
jgi:hypothetical protein